MPPDATAPGGARGATVLTEARGAVAVLTLNRPERLNAFIPELHRRYRDALAWAEQDPGIGAIVVTGAGRAFCAGADVDAVDDVAEQGDGYPAGRGRADGPRPGYGLHPDFDRPFAYHLGLSKPVVAAINGPAAGLGLVLACYCDVRFAAPGAKLTAAFGSLALPPEYGLSWLLCRLIGAAPATELLLSSRVFTSEEAARLGLVHRVIDVDELLDEAVAYAADVVGRCAPGALRATKHQLYLDLQRSLGDAYDASVAATDVAARSPDFREAVAARREHRPPRFRP